MQTDGEGKRNRGWSGAEAAAAVDDDALAGDEAGVVGGEEADRMGDVGGGSHRPAGTEATSESMLTMRPYRRACIPGSTARPSSTGLFTKKSSWATWSAQPT
jgi:hypothetical protein